MTTPGRLEVAPDGKVTGAADLTYNDPFPTANGSYGSGRMLGVVEHTMVGDLPGTVAWFNNPESDASAHFGVAQDGEIHQFGPLGKGWIAWAEAAGNKTFYSIEFADDQHPENPLTTEQVTAAAQLVELLSRFAGFPLQVSNNITTPGFVCHSDGGEAWGGHLSCPGPVRAAQREAIIELAHQIRDPTPVTPVKITHWRSLGLWSLAKEAADHHTTPQAMIAAAVTAGHTYGTAMKKYIAAGDWGARIPAGTNLYAPVS